MELIERTCAGPDCENTFKVMPSDEKSTTCSLYCFDRVKNTPWLAKSKRGVCANDRRMEGLKPGYSTEKEF